MLGEEQTSILGDWRSAYSHKRTQDNSSSSVLVRLTSGVSKPSVNQAYNPRFEIHCGPAGTTAPAGLCHLPAATTPTFAKAATIMAKVDLWRGLGMTVTGQSAFAVTTVTSVRVRTPYI